MINSPTQTQEDVTAQVDQPEAGVDAANQANADAAADTANNNEASAANNDQEPAAANADAAPAPKKPNAFKRFTSSAKRKSERFAAKIKPAAKPARTVADITDALDAYAVARQEAMNAPKGDTGRTKQFGLFGKPVGFEPQVKISAARTLSALLKGGDSFDNLNLSDLVDNQIKALLQGDLSKTLNKTLKTQLEVALKARNVAANAPKL